MPQTEARRTPHCTPRIRPAGTSRLRLPGHWAWWAAAGAVLLVLVIFGPVLDSGEKLIIRKVEDRLARRLDADVRVRSARLDLAGAELRNVEIRVPGGARIDSEKVRVPLDLAWVASGGGQSLADVRFHGVRIVLDPRSEETRDWLRGLRDGGAEPEGGDLAAGSGGGGAGGDGDGLGSGIDLPTVGLEISDLSVRLLDARGEPRDLFAGGSFRIDRSEERRIRLTGGATLAGGGRVIVEGADGPDGSELALRVTDLETVWILPFLPAGVTLDDTEQTRLAGRIDIARSAPGEPWAGAGRFEIEGVTLVSKELAEGPVTFPRVVFEVGVIRAGSLEDSGNRQLDLRDARLTVGSGLTVELDAGVTLRPEGLRLQVDAAVPQTACQELVGAVPARLLHDLEQMELDGTWSAHVVLDLDMADLQATELGLGVDDDCRFRGLPERLRAETLRGPFAIRMPAAEDGREIELATGPGSSHWVPMARISPYVEQAVLAHEDATFYGHGGFAPVAIRDSLVKNLEVGSFERGASTITMQLAKNLYLSRDKVLARKVREVFITWWLEHALTKREILALYLNVIEYGPNLYGIGPASHHYFGAPPSSLGPAEGVFLATVLPAPTAYHRNYARGSLSTSTEAEMRFLLRHMYRRDRIDLASMEWGLGALDSFSFGRVQPRPFSWRFWDRPEVWPELSGSEGVSGGSPPE